MYPSFYFSLPLLAKKYMYIFLGNTVLAVRTAFGSFSIRLSLCAFPLSWQLFMYRRPALFARIIYIVGMPDDLLVLAIPLVGKLHGHGVGELKLKRAENLAHLVWNFTKFPGWTLCENASGQLKVFGASTEIKCHRWPGKWHEDISGWLRQKNLKLKGYPTVKCLSFAINFLLTKRLLPPPVLCFSISKTQSFPPTREIQGKAIPIICQPTNFAPRTPTPSRSCGEFGCA